LIRENRRIANTLRLRNRDCVRGRHWDRLGAPRLLEEDDETATLQSA
jgi:hypothetical protein